MRSPTKVLLLVPAVGAAALGAATLWSRGPAEAALRPPLLIQASQEGEPTAFTFDRSVPNEPVTLLFYGNHAAAPAEGGARSVVADDGSVLIVSDRLDLRALPRSAPGAAVVGASWTGVGWTLSLTDGTLLWADSGGRVRRSTVGPFGPAALWPSLGGDVVAVRSPDRFAFTPELDDAALFASLDSTLAARPGGRIRRPAHALLASLYNAGHVVAHGDTIFYAPLTDARLVAFAPNGDTLWATTSNEPRTSEPKFAVAGGRATVEYVPATLGLTLGPDGRLYRIRGLDSTATTRMLDVIDAEDGRVLASAKLDSAARVIAVNARGRVYTPDEGDLLNAIAPRDREPFTPFAVPRRGGGHVSLVELRSKIVLVNFWASWCAPCREEMPALDSLQHELADERFALVGLNADADRRDAERFLAHLDVEMAVGFGGAGLSGTYHYPGLPYTVLLDGEGRIVRRWIGQLMPTDLAAIRLLVAAERNRLLGTRLAPTQPARHAH